MSKLLVLDPRGVDSADVIEAALAKGHEVFSVSHPNRSLDEVSSHITENVVVDFSGGDATLAALLAHATDRGIEGVVTTREYLTPLSARLASKLSLPCNDVDLADAPRNKIVMAERFRLSGVAAPATFVVTTEEEGHDLVHSGRLTFPLVVKPAENAASKGVTIVSTADQLPAAFDRVRTQTTAFDLVFDPRVILQEYVRGEEFSIESITQNGRTTHVCITRKITTHGAFRVEIGHSIPARLDDGVAANILSEASKAIAAVGIRNSVSHTEVILREDGTCVVLEIAARIGSGRIGVLTNLALGVDIPAASVDIALGQPVDARPRHDKQATVRLFLSPAEGRLAALHNIPAVSDEVPLVNVTQTIGSTVKGPQNNMGRIGQFIVTGTDEEAVNRRADELLNQVEIVVVPA